VFRRGVSLSGGFAVGESAWSVGARKTTKNERCGWIRFLLSKRSAGGWFATSLMPARGWINAGVTFLGAGLAVPGDAYFSANVAGLRNEMAC
jgi:hypothetical protein